MTESKRMTPQDIERELDADYKKFFDKVFDGKIPGGFKDLFLKAIMSVPPINHKLHSDAIVKIKNKETDLLTILEVGIMVNVLLATPFEKLFDSLDEATSYLAEMESVTRMYNDAKKTFDIAMKDRRATLVRLSGINGGSIPFSAGRK